MSFYTKYTWVEGVTQAGPTRFNALEAAVDDASKHHQSGTWAARPAADATSRGWTYFATDRGVLYCNFDGANWTRVSADAPIGAIEDFAGVSTPAGWLVGRGQTVSRTTYADLWAALRLTMTGNSANGNATLTITGAPAWIVGYNIYGPGVQANATVSSVTGTTVVMNLTANANNTGATYYIAPWGDGDGSTTFTLPDFRGSVAVGADKMDFLDAGSAARGVLPTSAYDIKLGNRNMGEARHTLVIGEIPSHQHTVTMKASTGADGGGPARGLLSSASTTINTGANGSGLDHENMPPFASVGRIIKAF